MELCEIRIPTYKRPQLLRRALNSVLEQDYPNWVALVMDDSSSQEAKSVVEALADTRIRYTPNAANLGCSGNINQAFTSNSLVGGAYACILEDDNWLLPSFLSENIASLKTHRVNVLLRNQEIWLQEETSTPTSRTTRGDWFISRLYTPLELHAYLLYFEGVSNGGLFWRTSPQSNFQVSHHVVDAGLQEYCRTLQIQENFYFAAKPLCCWSEMSSTLSLRNAVDNRTFGRGVQAIKRSLLKQYGEKIVQEAAQIGDRLNKQGDFERSLLDGLYTRYHFRQLSVIERTRQYLKSYIKFKLIKDPLDLYLANHPLNSSVLVNPH
jgi:glycosyltransferase involved in cell wall biosynthesis